MPMSTWTITAGVRVHGRNLAALDAIQIRPAITITWRMTSPTPLPTW
jgi:hypothetical protein